MSYNHARAMVNAEIKWPILCISECKILLNKEYNDKYVWA